VAQTTKTTKRHTKQKKKKKKKNQKTCIKGRAGDSGEEVGKQPLGPSEKKNQWGREGRIVAEKVPRRDLTERASALPQGAHMIITSTAVRTTTRESSEKKGVEGKGFRN